MPTGDEIRVIRARGHSSADSSTFQELPCWKHSKNSLHLAIFLRPTWSLCLPLLSSLPSSNFFYPIRSRKLTLKVTLAKVGVMDPSVKMKSFSYTKFFSWLKWSCLLCGLQFPCVESMGGRAWWVYSNCPFQFSSVQSLSRFWLFETPWTAACQASLSITNSWSLLKLMFTESVMPSNHLILYRSLLLPLSIFSSIRVFSNESALCIRWPKY